MCGDSSLDDALPVGVGGVLTMTGVPLSDAAVGVVGGVRDSGSNDLGLDWRRNRSVEPFFCTLVSTIAFLESIAGSVEGSCAGGSSRTGFVKTLGGLESAVAGRLSGLLEALLPVCDLVKLVLDLRRPLNRPPGEGDLLLREAGGARLFRLADPDGSESSKFSVVGSSW